MPELGELLKEKNDAVPRSPTSDYVIHSDMAHVKPSDQEKLHQELIKKINASQKDGPNLSLMLHNLEKAKQDGDTELYKKIAQKIRAIEPNQKFEPAPVMSTPLEPIQRLDTVMNGDTLLQKGVSILYNGKRLEIVDIFKIDGIIEIGTKDGSMIPLDALPITQPEVPEKTTRTINIVSKAAVPNIVNQATDSMPNEEKQFQKTDLSEKENIDKTKMESPSSKTTKPDAEQKVESKKTAVFVEPGLYSFKPNDAGTENPNTLVTQRAFSVKNVLGGTVIYVEINPQTGEQISEERRARLSDFKASIEEGEMRKATKKEINATNKPILKESQKNFDILKERFTEIFTGTQKEKGEEITKNAPEEQAPVMNVADLGLPHFITRGDDKTILQVKPDPKNINFINLVNNDGVTIATYDTLTFKDLYDRGGFKNAIYDTRQPLRLDAHQEETQQHIEEPQSAAENPEQKSVEELQNRLKEIENELTRAEKLKKRKEEIENKIKEIEELVLTKQQETIETKKQKIEIARQQELDTVIIPTMKDLIQEGKTINYDGEKVIIEEIRERGLERPFILGKNRGILNIDITNPDSYILYQNGKQEALDAIKEINTRYNKELEALEDTSN